MTSRITRVDSLSPARRYSLSLSLSEPCGASCRTSDRGSRHSASNGTMWSCCRDSKMPTSLRAFRYESHVFFRGSLFHFWCSSCDAHTKQGSHSFTDRKIQDFSRTPWKIFKDLFGARKCLNIKKNLQQTWQKSSTFRTVLKSAIVNTTWVLYYCSLFSIWTTSKMHDFEGYLPGPEALISRTFHDQSDFLGLLKSWIFKKKIQDFPGGVGTLKKVWCTDLHGNPSQSYAESPAIHRAEAIND